MDVVRVAPDVRRITAPNPGPKTLEGTNLYLVGSERQFLIDAGPDDVSFVEQLGESLRGGVEAILLTHDHPDHAGGLPRLAAMLGCPVWMSVCSSLVSDGRLPLRRAFEEDTWFDTGGGLLTAMPMPGHSPDHTCFWFEPKPASGSDGGCDGGRKTDSPTPGTKVSSLRRATVLADDGDGGGKGTILFSGDNILGRGTTLVALPEGDMSAYMETLDRIRELKPNRIAPGHGPIIYDPTAKLEEYIEHRRAREAEVLAALETVGHAVEIVDLVYRPDSAEIRRLAILSVEAQLAKLEREGRVEKDPDGNYRVRALS